MGAPLNPKLKTAVIGVGQMGRHHARIVHESPEAELVAVVDRDPDRGHVIADPLGVPVLSGVDEVCRSLDAAVISAPTPCHAELAVPLLEQGLAVLVEKPLAGDVASARRIAEAADTSGSVLQVGHVERFNPAVMAILDMGVQPVYVEARRISPFTLRSAEVGVVIDLMIHDLDIIMHLVKERPRTIQALGVGVITGKEDMANVRLTFPSGAVADISASRLAMKTERRIRMFSTDAYVSLDYVAKQGVVYRTDPRLKLNEFGAAGLEALESGPNFIDLFQQGLLTMTQLTMEEHEPLARQFEAFAAAVRREIPPEVDGRAGLEAVVTAEEVQRGIRAFAAQFET